MHKCGNPSSQIKDSRIASANEFVELILALSCIKLLLYFAQSLRHFLTERCGFYYGNRIPRYLDVSVVMSITIFSLFVLS